MMGFRINRRTRPTLPIASQREWRRMLKQHRKQKRRTSGSRRRFPKAILILPIVAIAAGAFTIGSDRYSHLLPGPPDVHWLQRGETAPSRPTVLRGGNALNTRSTELSGRAPSGNGVTGRVSHVRDGDTIEVAGTPIRIAALDCAETGTRQGNAATRRMRTLVSGEQLSCSLTGRRSYDRWIGSCRLSDGQDIADVMIREGACRRRRWR